MAIKVKDKQEESISRYYYIYQAIKTKMQEEVSNKKKINRLSISNINTGVYLGNGYKIGICIPQFSNKGDSICNDPLLYTVGSRKIKLYNHLLKPTTFSAIIFLMAHDGDHVMPTLCH